MSSSVIGRIIVGMEVQTGKLKKGLGTGAKALNAFGKDVTKNSTVLSGLGSSLSGVGGLAALGPAGIAAGVLGKGLDLVAAGATAATTALAGLAAVQAKAIDETGDEAERIGVSTDALMKLKAVAQLTGTEATAVAPALQKMLVNLGKATDVDETGRALQSLGLDLKTLKTQDPSVTFKQIAAAIGRLPSSADQAAAAMSIFGKSGTALINTFHATAATMEAVEQHAMRVGAVVSELDRQKVGAMWDAFDKAKLAVQGLGNQLAIQLAPAVTEIVELFNTWAASGPGMGARVKAGVDLAISAVEVMAGAVQQVVAQWYALQTAVNAVVTAATWGSLQVVKGLNMIGLASDEAVTGMEAMVDGMVAATKESAKAFVDTAGADWGKDIRDGWNAAQQRATAAANAVAEGNKAAQSMGQTVFAIQQDAAALEQELMKTRNAFGANADEAKILALVEQGLPYAEAERLRIIAKQNEALKEQHDEAERIRKSVEQMNKAGNTPLEKYMRRLEEIKKMEQAGLRSDIADEQRDEAHKQYQSTGEKFVGKTPLEKYKEQLAEIDKAVKQGTLAPEKEQRAKYNAYREFSKTSEGVVGSTPLDSFKDKLADLWLAFKDGTINQEQYTRAVLDAKKAFLGIDTTPLQKYRDRIEQINKAVAAGNLSKAEGEYAKGQAKRDFLGIDETPLDRFRKRLLDLNAAFQRGDISADEARAAVGRAIKSYRDAYKGLTDEIATPMEKYLEKVAEIDKALAEGGITNEQADKLKAKAKKDSFGQFQFAGAQSGTLGSSELRSAILAHRYQGKNAPDSAQEETAKNTAKLADARLLEDQKLFFQRAAQAIQAGQGATIAIPPS